MKIEWNKVTWYSKTLALILFVALPFIGFYYGMQYGKTAAATPVSNGSAQTSNYYENISDWQTDSNNSNFSIAYPIDFSVGDNYNSAPSTDWRVNAQNTSGVKAITITVPSAFEPQTNFADAMLTVGYSNDSNAIAECLQPDQSGGPAQATSTANINGTTFTVFQSNSAGAGSYYQTTSYRTVNAGTCYAVEYTIHSSQIANYPSSYNLQPFNEAQITNVLQTIVDTFKFS